MTDLRRTVRCSSCGNDSSVAISSELTVSELTIAGKCSHCGSSMQINYTLVDKTVSAAAPAAPKLDTSSDAPLVNIDESLFTPEIPSDAIRDLMED